MTTESAKKRKRRRALDYESDVEWHGWSTTAEPYKGESLHIGPLPGRKSICLYTMDYDKGTMFVHAYFRNEGEAKHALDTLDNLMGKVIWHGE